MLRSISLLLLIIIASIGAVHAVDSTSTTREQTLSIIKPDAVAGNHIGEIIALFEKNGLRIDALSMKQLTKQQAEDFYAVHRDRPFYKGLVDFMISGPVVILVLDGENAIAKNREIMGATDPMKAEKGTIRSNFAKSMGENAVHGSDSKEAAKTEIQFFFKPDQVFIR
ncbi:MAG: nucleoside-diphosphate kinase [Parachlamydiaceae bacterium]|nr:nucleoside-diphosphate kinase [Parachlamydiaceae bacterium]